MTTFEQSAHAASSSSGIPFGYHIYDLSKGIGQRFGPSLVNAELPLGVLHGSLVIFGNEYFFEGNVSKRPAGCTRFGKNFSFVPAPCPATAVKTEEEWENWLRSQELIKYGAISYELLENNCIHFIDAATTFLTEGKGELPAEIKDNTKPIVESDVGRLIMDFAKIMSNCGMLQGCEMMRQRRMCKTATYFVRKLMRDGPSSSNKKESNDKKKNATEEDVPSPVSPVRLHYFSFDFSSSMNESFLKTLMTRLEVEIEVTFEDRLEQRKISKERMIELFNPTTTTSTKTLIMMTSEEATTISTSLTQALTSKESCSSFKDFKIILQIFSHLAALHDNFCQALAHDTVMKVLIRSLSNTFFCALPLDLKIVVLELFCNLMMSPICGSFLTRTPSYQNPLCFMISRGLLEPDSWVVVHRASCLLLSYVFALVTLRHNAFEEEIMRRGANHSGVKCLGIGMFLLRSVLPDVQEISSSSQEKTMFETPEKAHFFFLEKQRKAQEEKLEKIRMKKEGKKNTSAASEGKGGAAESSLNNSLSRVADMKDSLEAVRALSPLVKISQAILENIVESMLQFATSGRECTSILVTHSMAPEMDRLKMKCATKRAMTIVHDLALIM